MKEIVEFLAKALVDNPDQVQVTAFESDDDLQLELRVAEEDLGKVIGRRGRIAKSMRTVLKAAAIKDGRRVSLAIARILSAVGTEGWVRIESLSHSSGRFEQLERVYAARTLDEEYPIPLAVDEVQVEPDRIDLAFLGITDATKAQELTDYYLLIPEEERAELGEDHYYIDDLQGLRVVDSSGADIGVVLKENSS